MASNGLEIIASLDIPNSVSNIVKDTKEKVTPQVNQQKPLKLIGSLDIAKTKSLIQSQLATIANSSNNLPKINLGVNVGNITQGVNQAMNSVTNTVNNTNSVIGATQKKLTDLKAVFTNPIRPVFDSNGLINVEKTIERVKDKYKQLGEVSVSGTYSKINNQDVLNGLGISIQNSIGEVRTLNFELNNTNKLLNYSGSKYNDKALSTVFTKAKDEADKLQKTIERIQVKSLDVNTTKPIKNADNLSQLSEQYNKATNAVNNLKNANVENFNALKNTANDTIQRYNDLVKSLRNAEYAATKLRTLDIATIKTDETNNLQQFISKIQGSKVAFTSLQGDIDKLKTSLASVTNKESLTAYLNELSNVQTKFKALSEQTKLVSGLNSEIDKSVSKLKTLSNSSIFNSNANNSSVVSTRNQIASLVSEYDKLKISLSQTNTSEGILKIQNDLANLGNRFNTTVSSATNFANNLKNTASIDNLQSKIANLTNQIIAYKNANSKAMTSTKTSSNGITFANEVDNLLAKLKLASDPAAYNKIANNFRNVKSEIKSMGLQGENFIDGFWNKLKKFAGWMGLTTFTASLARQIRGMFTDIVDLDTALVDLRKTFKGTDEDLKSFYFTANDTAKQLGVTTKEVIDAASSWSRLGFSTKDSATEMAKASAIFASISPGMSIDTATTGLVSVMKAFGIEVNDVTDGILSKVNIIGNNFATSNSEILEGLSRSSAAMAAMGSNFEESVSLFTAGQEILQDASTMGTALRSISLRIRGYDEETEKLSEDLTDITGKVIDLTKVASNNYKGVSLFTDETQTEYKTIYTYLTQIADIYDELSAKDSQELLERLFGKQRTQAGAAILTNIETAKKSLEMMSDSNSEGKWHCLIVQKCA